MCSIKQTHRITRCNDTRRNGKLISPIIHTLCIILRQECVGICQINKDLFVVCYSNNELLCCCQFGFQNASPRPSGYRKILPENEMSSPYEAIPSNAKTPKRGLTNNRQKLLAWRTAKISRSKLAEIHVGLQPKRRANVRK